MRLTVRNGGTVADALTVLRKILAHRRHRFWVDDIGFDVVSLAGVVGHRQVTDAYLAGLARHNGGRLATLDAALAALHPDVAALLPG